MPRITRPQSLPSCRRGSTGWCVRCCPGNGSDRRSCCCGWRIRSYATSGRAAPTKDAAPPAEKAGWSHHLKHVVVVLEGCRVSRVPEPNSGGQEHCGLASSARFHLSSGVLFASSSPTCHSALKVSAPMIRDPSRPEAGVRVLSTWQDPRSAAGPRKRLKSPFPFSIYVFPLECVSHVSVVPFWPYLFYHPYHPLFLLL